MQQVTTVALQRAHVGCAKVGVLCAQIQAAHDSLPRDAATVVAVNTSAVCLRETCTVEEADWRHWVSIQVCVNGDATTMKRNGSSTTRRTPDFADLRPNMIPVLSPRFGATSTDNTAFQEWVQLASIEHMWYDKIVGQGRAR